VTELPPYRVRDLISKSSAGHGVIHEVISRMMTAASSSSGLILNTYSALEADELASLRHDLTVPVFDIGPLHALSPAASKSSLLQQDRGCLDWLDGQPPSSVLYVSFGSLASVSAADLVEAAWGVANSGRPFPWVLRPGLVAGDDDASPSLPDGFDTATSGRGKVVSWAPQEEVLAHPAVGGFWTHCGWNSTLEGVCAGVPMLCRPCFGDQMGNARYVEHVWRIGVELNGELERCKVLAAIEALMDGVELRCTAQELKSRAAECMAEAGSSSTNVDKLVKHILFLSRD
jgi:UDP-glucosyltransferase BX8/BX9